MPIFLSRLPSPVKHYLLITANYWAFTLTDGALRMLVILHFHQLGYSPLSIAMLFLFYEVFGIITNLVGGWIGARIGLNRVMHIGLLIQLLALSLLLAPSSFLSLGYVMTAQALSGIAKDLNKMSAKSAIKLLLPEQAQGQLFNWIALLTGSKNTLKGLGFFLGAVLLSLVGFSGAIVAMIALLMIACVASLLLLKEDIGRASQKPKFREVFSNNSAINRLSLARLFLFAARDVWFVIALPVYLAQTLGWSHLKVGGFMASWVIGYGLVQALAPTITRANSSKIIRPSILIKWTLGLSVIPALMAFTLQFSSYANGAIFGGLTLFAIVFAVNSSLHSYLIVHYARRDGVSLDVGFYYMANAMGRLLGTLLSGWVFQQFGLAACLCISSAFIAIAALSSLKLPANSR